MPPAVAFSTDIPSLIRQHGLTLQASDLPTLDANTSTAWVESLKSMLRELSENRNKSRVYSFDDTLATLMHKLDALKSQLMDGGMDVHDLAQVPVEAFRRLEDCMNLPMAHTTVLDIEDEIKQLLTCVEHTNEIKAIALNDGEMHVAEEQFYLKASQLEKLMLLSIQKLELCQSTDGDHKMFDAVDAIQDKATEHTAAIKRGKRRLKDAAANDLQALDTAEATARREFDALQASADMADGGGDRWLLDNQTQREELWRRIQELEREFQRLCEARAEEINRRQSAKENLQRQQEQYSAYLVASGHHRNCLRNVTEACDGVLAAARLIEDVVAESCDAIKSRTDRSKQMNATTTAEAQQGIATFYRRLYRCLGHLRYKKEKRLEDIDQAIRASHIQLEMCIETFDPVAKKHATTKKDMYRVRAELEDAIRELGLRMQRATDTFQPIADALDAAGIEWVDPQYEVDWGNLDRRTQMVEYRAHMAKPEEVKIAAERAEIQRSWNVLRSRSNSPSRALGSSSRLAIRDD